MCDIATQAAKLHVVSYILQVTLQQDYGALKGTGAFYTRKHYLFQKAYNPTSHPTEGAALAAQTKIIHSQHSVNSHPVGTHLHVAMIHAGKNLADLYTGPSTSIRGRNFHPEEPCVQKAINICIMSPCQENSPFELSV